MTEKREYPPIPDGFVPVKSFREKQMESVLCIKVKPSDDNPASSGHDYALAAPSVEIQKKVQDILDIAVDDDRLINCDSFIVLVNGVKFTLKYMRENQDPQEYSLKREYFSFDVLHGKPDWAMTLPEFVKDNSNAHRDFFFYIIVKGTKPDPKGNLTAYAFPHSCIQAKLLEAMRSRDTTASWEPIKRSVNETIVDYDLRVNISECRIRDKKTRKVFKLMSRVTVLLPSDPYINGETILSNSFSGKPDDEGNTWKFSIPLSQSKNVEKEGKGAVMCETVRVEKGLIGSNTCLRHAIVAKNSSEGLIALHKQEKDGEISYTTAKAPLFTYKTCGSPFKVKIEGEERDVSEGEFVWLYQDPPPKDRRSFRTEFSAKPFSLENCKLLEEGKILGKESVSLTYEDEDKRVIVVEVNLVNGKMYQVHKDNRFFFRRVWRVGSSFKPKLYDVWAHLHKFRDYTLEVPQHWSTQQPGECNYVPLDKEKDRKEYAFVMSTIASSIDAHEKHGDPDRGIGGVSRRRGRGSVAPAKPKEEASEEKKEEPKPKRAMHIACICRIEKPGPFKSFCVGKNEILNERGSHLSLQPASLYLAANPLSTYDAGLDTKVNEQWLFNGSDARFACATLEDNIDLNMRAAATSNCFGSGLYFTDDFLKAAQYCSCPRCKGGKRKAYGCSKECICKSLGLNLTHPRVVFLSRVALGNMFFVRDIPYYRLFGDPSSFLPPSNRFLHKPGIYVWYDAEKDSEDEAKVVSTLFDEKQYTVNPPRKLPPTPNIENMDLIDIFKETPLNLFYIKRATMASPGYKMLYDYIMSLPPRDSLSRPTFAFIVDEDADDESEKLAKELHALLARAEEDSEEDLRRATEMFYLKKDTTLKKLLEKHKDDPDMKDLCEKDLFVDPGRGRKVELPDTSVFFQDEYEERRKTSPSTPESAFVKCDSVFVEDVIHSSPQLSLDFPIATNSLFDVRQGKRREFVVFDQKRVYQQYAILFYPYESEALMEANKDKEYPHHRHGVSEEKKPLYFVHRDLMIGSEDNPQISPEAMKELEVEEESAVSPSESLSSFSSSSESESSEPSGSSQPHDGCFTFMY